MKRIAFCAAAFCAVCAFGQHVARNVKESDRLDWSRTLPVSAIFWDMLSGRDYEESWTYHEYTNIYDRLSSKLYQPISWMQHLRDVATDHYTKMPTNETWMVSPIFGKVTWPPESADAAASWNPRTLARSPGGLPSGEIFYGSPSNIIERMFEDAVAGQYAMAGFEYSLDDSIEEWPSGYTIDDYAFEDRPDDRDRALLCVRSGWRLMTDSIRRALMRLLAGVDGGRNRVAAPGVKFRRPRGAILQAEWSARCDIGYTITERDGKYYYEGSVKKTNETSYWTNEVAMSSGVLYVGGSYSGDEGPIILSGPVLAGYPDESVVTNLEQKAEKTTVDGLSVYAVGCADVIAQMPIGSHTVSAYYTASWVQSDIQPEAGLIPLPLTDDGRRTVKLPEGKSFDVWSSSDFTAFVPYLLRFSEYSDAAGESASEDKGVITLFNGDWGQAVARRLFFERIPSSARQQHAHSPDGQCGGGEIEVQWDNIGVVHYWSADTDQPLYFGFRVNGKDYAEAEFETFDPEDPEGVGTFLGYWVALLAVSITGESCENYWSQMDINSGIFAIGTTAADFSF